MHVREVSELNPGVYTIYILDWNESKYLQFVKM